MINNPSPAAVQGDHHWMAQNTQNHRGFQHWVSKGRSSAALALLGGALGRGIWQDREVSSKARCSPCDSYIRIVRVTKKINATFTDNPLALNAPMLMLSLMTISPLKDIQSGPSPCAAR